MSQQIDGVSGPADDACLDRRLIVVESTYATKDVVAASQVEMRSWLIAQTISLALFLVAAMAVSNSRLDAVERRLDRIETRMDRLEARIERLEARVEQMDARTRNIESQLSEIRSYIVANPRR